MMGLGCALGPSCAGSDRPDPPPDMMLGGGGCPTDLPDEAACDADAPSYAEQTAAMIDERCRVCHFSGNLQSPRIFESYEDVFEQRRGMLTQIYSCRMPPEGSPALSSTERRALLQWFVCGAPDN
jgi:cytochrome c5